MAPSRLGRFVYYAQWWFAILLPVFFFWGRAVFGSTLGWLTVFGFVFGVPIILAALIPPIVTRFDLHARAARSTSRGYAIACVAGWSAAVVAGLAIPDGGDSGETGSALTRFGLSEDASSVTALVGIVITVIAWGVSLLWAITDASASRRTPPPDRA